MDFFRYRVAPRDAASVAISEVVATSAKLVNLRLAPPVRANGIRKAAPEIGATAP